MRNFLRFGFGLLFIFGGFDGVGQTIDPDYIDGEFYIKLKKVDKKSFSKTSSAVNFQKELPFLSNLTSSISVASAERSFYFSNSELLQSVYRVKIDNPKKGLDFMNSVEQDDNVEYIERVPLMKISIIPNDPYRTSQYALSKIKAYDAWNVSTGNYYVTVAVVDDAVQTNHPDLAGNIVAGFDVADNDNNPNPPNTYFSHGTHVAGITGAVTNNGMGIASLGFNSIRIMPIKTTPNTAIPSTGKDNVGIYYGYEGITWAAEHGADVINMSWGGGTYSITNQNTITYAHNLGCVLVAAAGNDNSSSLHYPSAYNYVICVASTDENDYKSSFSNYDNGTGWVDIAAPGTGIYSTLPFSNYVSWDGTSMASPLVASLCGYILSQNPNLNPDDVEYILKNSSDYIGYTILGAGRINALNAVNYKYFRSQNINGQNLCSGSNLYIDLITYGNYYSGNQFYIQYAQINSGTFYNLSTTRSTLPAGYYKIRVVSTSPSIIGDYSTVYINGSPTGSPIASQYSLATTTLYNATSTCAGNYIGVYGNVSGYDSYWWTKDGQNLTASSTNNYLNASSTGTYTLKMMKCGNVYTSSNSIYLRFYDPSSPTLTASIAGGISSNSMLNICDGTSVGLSTNCQVGDNPIWDNGTTTITRNVYVNASSTANFSVKCSNYFCTTANAPPVRIVNQPFIQSTKSGNWQDPTMWTNNYVPLNCQTVTIQTGHTVNVPINDAKAKNIIIKGNLNFQNVSPTVKGKVGLGI
jgi:subtilisin family serine protease